MSFCRLAAIKRVIEQACDGHWANAARHRCDGAGNRLRRLRNSTSPTSLFFPSSVVMRLIPTSITVAPGLIQSPLIISGRPTAATRMSALRQTSGRSRVREWATVTVQCSLSNNCSMGLPTILERPTTTALSPDKSPSLIFQHHDTAGRCAREQ